MVFFSPGFSFKTKACNARIYEKPCSLKVGSYAVHLIDLNEHLASFPGATIADKIGVTKQNEILLNIMTNSCSKEAYVQGFYCGSTSFKRAVNMFEHMEIEKSIYESVVTPSY